MPSKCPRCSKTSRGLHLSQIQTFEYALNVIQNWETDALQFYLMVEMKDS